MDFTLEKDIYNTEYIFNSSIQNLLVRETVFSDIYSLYSMSAIIFSNSCDTFTISKTTFNNCIANNIINLLNGLKGSSITSTCFINCNSNFFTLSSTSLDYFNYTVFTSSDSWYWLAKSSFATFYSSQTPFPTNELNGSNTILSNFIYYKAHSDYDGGFLECNFIHLYNCVNEGTLNSYFSSFDDCKIQYSSFIDLSNFCFRFTVLKCFINNCIMKELPESPLFPYESYENYSITNCLLNFNLSDKSLELFENNTYSTQIPVLTNFSIASCAFYDEKEEIKTGIISLPIETYRYNKYIIHDSYFSQIICPDKKSLITIQNYFGQLNFSNIQISSSSYTNCGAIYIHYGISFMILL